MTIRIGAHVDQADPIAEAQARGTTLVQFFLGDPQGYKGPEVRYAGGAEALRADAEAAGVDLYVHAPYIVNVATTNNRIRIPSRKLLQQHVDAAAAIGAKGLIVHGGHVNKGDDPDKRVRQLAQGGRGDRPQGAAADREHRRRRQRDGPPPRPDRRGLGRRSPAADGADRSGFCLDTCHAHAGGIDLVDGGRPDPRDHRADRPGARQRQPRRLRLRRRPARQLRRRPDRPRRARRGGPRCRGARWSARRPAVPAEHRADFAWLRDRL